MFRSRLPVTAALLLATTALVPAAARPSPTGTAAASPVLSLQLAPEPLDIALRRVAAQAGAQLRYGAPLPAGARAPAVSGSLPLSVALERLLAGTGFGYRLQPGLIEIAPPSQASQASENLQVWGRRAAADAYGLAFGKPKVLTTSTSRAQLEQLQIDSLADYGRRVDAAVDYNARNDSINIRGLDQNRIVTTVDGIPIPWLLDNVRSTQGGSSSFDFDGLSRFDVVKDSDSSVYGAGALGGVVAAQTLEPADVLTGEKRVGGLSKVVYNSADRSIYVSQAVAARVNWTSVLLQGSYRDGGQLRNSADTGGSGTTRTETNPADVVQRDLLGKIDQKLAYGQHVGLLGEYYVHDDDENTLTSVVPKSYSAYRTDTINRRKRVAVSYDLDAPDKDGWIDKAHVIAYYQKQGQELATYANRLSAPVGEYDRDATLREASYGGIFSASKTLHTLLGQHEIAAGGDVRGTLTTEYAAGTDNCTARIASCAYLHNNEAEMPDTYGVDAGFFVQDKITLLNRHLRITPGLRFDYYDRSPSDSAAYQRNAVYAGLPAGSSDHKVSPKVLAEYDIRKNLTLFLQWSQAFRAPSANELYLTYGTQGAYETISNPHLKPETSNGAVAGVDLGDDDLGARFSFYDTYYHNFIDLVTYTAADLGVSGNFPYGVFQEANRNHVQIYGAEFAAHWNFRPHWHSWLSANYSHGRDTDADTYINTIPAAKGIVGVGYGNTVWGFDGSVTATLRRSDVANDNSALNKTPGYAILDLTGWWQPGFAPGLRLQAGLFNILDQRYYDALDIPDNATLSQAYYTQPGRTFKLQATMRF